MELTKGTFVRVKAAGRWQGRVGMCVSTDPVTVYFREAGDNVPAEFAPADLEPLADTPAVQEEYEPSGN